MRRAVTRRDFLKLAGVGAASVALVGSAAGGRGLFAAPNGAPAWVATWLPDGRQGFPARVLVAGGQARSIAPNPAHPLAAWFNPAAAAGLLHAANAPRGSLAAPNGPAAVRALSAVFRRYRASEIAFITGEYPDHLHDLAQLLAAALGGASVLRHSPAALRHGRIALQDAAWRALGLARLPQFDLPQAGLVFAFGVDGDEPWLATPTGENQAAGWVCFDPWPPAQRPGAEWVRIPPGSHARAAQALAEGVACLRRGVSPAELPSILGAAGEACGLDPQALAGLAVRFAGAARPVAIPGGRALAAADGVLAARRVLELNAAAGRLGAPGGVFLPLDAPLHPALDPRPATLEELAALVERIRSGQVKALLALGANPAAELPAALDARAALAQLEFLASFGSIDNETSALAHLALPAPGPLESLGYQRSLIGAGRPLVAAVLPALAAGGLRRSPADVLLAAARAAGAPPAALPYRDEADFIRKSLRRLRWHPAEDPAARWQSQGGWWEDRPLALPAVWVDNYLG